jgi:predicted DNA-binding transcriptional regulator AlpA
MGDSQDKRPYLDIDELIVRSGLSRATIWRLKRAGKIPFFQPGGKGGRVKFPEDALEQAGRCEVPSSVPDDDESVLSKRLPGPRPQWMSPSKRKQ